MKKILGVVSLVVVSFASADSYKWSCEVLNFKSGGIDDAKASVTQLTDTADRNVTVVLSKNSLAEIKFSSNGGGVLVSAKSVETGKELGYAATKQNSESLTFYPGAIEGGFVWVGCSNLGKQE